LTPERAELLASFSDEELLAELAQRRKKYRRHGGGPPVNPDRCICRKFTKEYAAGRNHKCGACNCGWAGPVSNLPWTADKKTPCPQCDRADNWKELNR
jgi:hypothetical protein